MSDIDCPGCEERHDDRYLCDPGKALLDAIAARAGSYTMPTIEFDEPVPASLNGITDVLMRQFVVQGGTAEVAGVARPLIILTGRGMNGEPLPRWTYIGTEQEIAAARNLLNRMCSLAIDAARKARRRSP